MTNVVGRTNQKQTYLQFALMDWNKLFCIPVKCSQPVFHGHFHKIIQTLGTVDSVYNYIQKQLDINKQLNVNRSNTKQVHIAIQPGAFCIESQHRLISKFEISNIKTKTKLRNDAEAFHALNIHKNMCFMIVTPFTIEITTQFIECTTFAIESKASTVGISVAI